MAALEKLDDEQRKAVFAPPGTVRIIAGPGSRKAAIPGQASRCLNDQARFLHLEMRQKV